MVRVGLLAEYLYRGKLPLYMGTVAPDAFTALRFQFDSAPQPIDFLAVRFTPEDAAGGWIVFASAPWSARPAPALAKVLGIRGEKAVKLDAHEGSGRLLGTACADCVQVLASDGWGQYVLFP